MENYYDFIVIGSGFGGSVAALRLAEKGYSVLVIEKGKKYSSQDFPGRTGISENISGSLN